MKHLNRVQPPLGLHAATCAAPLGLPNLNYIYGTNNMKLKRVKEGKNPSNPRLRTAGHPKSSLVYLVCIPGPRYGYVQYHVSCGPRKRGMHRWSEYIDRNSKKSQFSGIRSSVMPHPKITVSLHAGEATFQILTRSLKRCSRDTSQ